MATINTTHLLQCIKTLESSLAHLQSADPNAIEYEVFRNATIKGFELTLEISGKLLRKVLKAYAENPRTIDELTFKDVFRQAAKHRLLDTKAVERWFNYRANRNDTAHYGIAFAKTTLQLLPEFIKDAKNLELSLQTKHS